MIGQIYPNIMIKKKQHEVLFRDGILGFKFTLLRWNLNSMGLTTWIFKASSAREGNHWEGLFTNKNRCQGEILLYLSNNHQKNNIIIQYSHLCRGGFVLGFFYLCSVLAKYVFADANVFGRCICLSE